jgi:hypothetical protein
MNDIHLERHQHPCKDGATCNKTDAQHKWRYLHPCSVASCTDKSLVYDIDSTLIHLPTCHI